MPSPAATFPEWIAPAHPGPVLVGFSGGLDSTVLLHALAACTRTRDGGLRALHVHHGLHPDADAWAGHCAAVCAALDVPLETVRVHVALAAGDGPEGAARRARHAAFERALRAGELLALAHHRDDQAETVLLRLLRASGPDGLAAMRPWRRCGRGWLWRPLLATPRDALRGAAQDLAWIEDPGNGDEALDRNFLRLRVLPRLRERWPSADAALARVAALQDETVALLRAEDAAALARCRTPAADVLMLPALRESPAARRARVLRDWVQALGLPPLPAGGVDRIERELLPAAADTEARYAWSGARIVRWRDLLHAGRDPIALPADWSVAWDGAAMTLPGGDLLRLECADGPPPPRRMRVHARVGGERIALPNRRHSHALKHVLQALGVPPWERTALPLVSDGQGTLLAAGDLVYSGEFDDWLRAHRARIRWRRAGT